MNETAPSHINASRTVGAHFQKDGVHYRVWAPNHQTLNVIVLRAAGGEERIVMEREADGHFHAVDSEGRAGDRYWYEDGEGERRPDVASRFQPEGVHGPSEVIDPRQYRWRSSHWRRPAVTDQIIYEIHLGTFTPEGTFRSAIGKLDHVKELGATAIEIMPVADFPGDRNWGYDGVALFAPARCYGRPDDFRALVDAAHERGLAVILDVVYNHLGPDGNYLPAYSDFYFHDSRANTWGSSFSLDGEHSGPVREFFLSNLAYWLDEFRVDGLRLDATHAVHDDSPRHLLAEFADAAHARGAFLIAEDERNEVTLLHDAKGEGIGIDAVWSDDFHHATRVALTGVRESYFKSYRGTGEELARTLRQGWSYCGETFPFWQGRRRGGPCLHLEPAAFVFCIQNHDQVGNRALGERLEHLIAPEAYRAASALVCLAPYTPLLFMGQEWAASTPFQFFTDHSEKYGVVMREGRLREFADTGLNADREQLSRMPDPQDEATFLRSKLKWEEARRDQHGRTLALYRECLHWRSEHLRGAAVAREHWEVGAQGDVVYIRFRLPGAAEWVLVTSLHGQARLAFAQNPQLVLPRGQTWQPRFHTNERRFGGHLDRPGAQRFGPGDEIVFDQPATAVLVSVSDDGL
jgi:maltooligosyltrehalose trehalohydrolase